MSRTLYSALFYLALPFLYLRLLRRSLRAPAYRQRWRERLGFYGQNPQVINKNGPNGSHSGLKAGLDDGASLADEQQRTLVIHAVSVGEVHAAVPLIEQIQQAWPQWNIVLTTSTPTGSERVKSIFGQKLTHVYLPYDVPGAVQRFLGYTRPNLLILMETELWPNLIHYSHQQGVAVLLANARLSKKSLRGYLKGGSLVRQMLENISVLAAQSDSDGERFIQLGLPQSRLQITGTMKFDISGNEVQVDAGRAFKQALDGRPVVVAGSTREGEEEKVFSAFAQILAVHPDALLILVPRHPERFDGVYSLLCSRGLQGVRRSEINQRSDGLASSVQVLLGDTMGEMSFYYGAADLAFVGGSLVDTGCQNIIEPAALGLPVITGPSLFNFQSISALLIEAGAMRVVANADELATTLIELIENKADAQEMAKCASALVETNRGASERLLGLVEKLLKA